MFNIDFNDVSILLIDLFPPFEVMEYFDDNSTRNIYVNDDGC